ncbi:minor capsid protein [Fusobacterium ulcerans]|uniref:minor capsid protein n=1 Tax=Fusobacterium ulcerans TaxID=861 RepID=UPI003FEFC430
MAKKSSYWQERFLEEEERINKDARAYAKRIEQQYDIALRNIERDITDWYGRIAKNNNVSLLEAKRMLSTKELAEFKWNVNEYIKAGETNAVSPIWMKELENASARVHISRLEALKIQIQSEIEGIYGIKDKEMQNYLVRTYGETYYHTAYEIQKGNGVGWSLLNKLDTNKVNTIIHKPWAADGKNFSERIWEDKTKLINTLHTGLTQNFIRGEALDKLISSITKEFNIKKSAAARLVMTESAAYSSQAREKSFKSIGVKKYEIVATLDNKTSEICQNLDGEVFEMKDYQVGVTAPPFHVWCRTTTAPWFPENYDSERIARGTDGKTYKIPGDMNYKDWKEKYVNSKISELTLEEERAIMKYKSPSMYELNDKLRSRIELSSEEKEWVKNLDSALKKMPYYEGTVTRCLKIDRVEELNKFLRLHKPKDIIVYPAYTSTSMGELYNPESQIILKINSTKARDIKLIGLNEDETLYERNCKFKVIDVVYNKEGKFEIELEEFNEQK